MGYRIVTIDGDLVKTPSGLLRLPSIASAVHRNQSGRIIVNYPGRGGKINGYNEKHRRLANYLQEQGVGAVVRTANPSLGNGYYPLVLLENLRSVVRYCLTEAEEICGSKEPQIGLMGTSAGGAAVLAVAHEFPQVDKVLALNASGDARREDIERGLRAFRGDLYIAAGAEDELINPTTSEYYHSLATTARSRRFVLIPGCDHQFKGDRNGRIFSHAALWAFAGDESFPDPEKGIWYI